MKNILKLLLSGILLLQISSCVKEDYDEPFTANVDPDLQVTHTLEQLRALATSTTPIALDSNIIVAGIITADDASGAFYKEMIIQDTTAGISIQLDVSNYNSNYPIGRRMFVKCGGLYIAKDQDGNVEVGASSNGEIGRIPGGAVQAFLYPGRWGLDLPFVDVSLDYLTNNPTDFCQKLVRIPSVEFQMADAGVEYGGSVTSTSDNNRTLQDCSNNNLVVYTSSYANFANAKTPYRNGIIQGILKIYRNEGELILRDLDDVQMADLRCDGSSGIPSYMPLDSVRMMDPGTNTVNLPGDKFIRVVVTNDYTKNITNGRNIYCQDSTAGIMLRFDQNHSFAIGTVLQVTVSGASLSNFAGMLQINVPLSSATVVSPSNLSVPPRNVTINDANNNYTAWECQLVSFSNVTITGGATYSGSSTLTDASGGSIVLYTSSAATFSTTALPAAATKITGILVEYNGTKELIIRDPAIDVVQ